MHRCLCLSLNVPFVLPASPKAAERKCTHGSGERAGERGEHCSSVLLLPPCATASCCRLLPFPPRRLRSPWWHSGLLTVSQTLLRSSPAPGPACSWMCCVKWGASSEHEHVFSGGNQQGDCWRCRSWRAWMLRAQCPAVRICIWRFFNRVPGHLPVAGRWLGESGINVLHKSFAEKMRQTDRFPGWYGFRQTVQQ